jgi:serine/threonine protein kinase
MNLTPIANILVEVGEDGVLRLKLCDFTYAKVLDEEALTQTMCGTPLYMV